MTKETTRLIIRYVNNYGWLGIVEIFDIERARSSFYTTPQKALAAALKMSVFAEGMVAE